MSLHTVDAKTLRHWIDRHEAVLVDVREPAEHATQNIPGATLVPLTRVSASTLPPHAGKKLVIHCRKGGRGGSACEKLLAENPALEIYNLEGGIESWSAAGFATGTGGRKVLPVDRQVQLAIGLALLLANALGYLVNPAFYWLTAVFGAGLTFAGLTGFCGLALLMARMPWNR